MARWARESIKHNSTTPKKEWMAWAPTQNELYNARKRDGVSANPPDFQMKNQMGNHMKGWREHQSAKKKQGRFHWALFHQTGVFLWKQREHAKKDISICRGASDGYSAPRVV